MTQAELAALDDEKLIWLCVEPLIRNARAKAPEVKLAVFRQLNGGQKALFSFQTLYGHANQGISRFFLQISYMTDTLDIWSALKSSMKYFGDSEMLTLIDKMEQLYYSDLKLNENIVLLNELDILYRDRITETVKLIGSYIRNNSDVFIQHED